MATIGRSHAILQIGHMEITGFAAWLIRLFIHIYYIIGFKNKLFVFLQWAFFYMTYKKGARLIVDKCSQLHSVKREGEVLEERIGNDYTDLRV
jgi:NADH dehydrogenase